MKFWFITGVPGTGKTTIGNYLADNHGFKHLDVEVVLQSPNPAEIIQQTIKEAQNNDSDLVITWGFQPGSDDQTVIAIKNLNAKLIWFDGNREAAKRAFIKRGGVSIDLLDIQMGRINSVNIIETFNPISFNTFDDNGEFLDKAEIVKQLTELTR